jgi:hypothetical protein
MNMTKNIKTLHPANKGADPACHAPDQRRGGDTHVISVEKNQIGATGGSTQTDGGQVV